MSSTESAMLDEPNTGSRESLSRFLRYLKATACETADSRRVQNRGTTSRRLTSVAPKVVLLW